MFRFLSPSCVFTNVRLSPQSDILGGDDEVAFVLARRRVGELAAACRGHFPFAVSLSAAQNAAVGVRALKASIVSSIMSNSAAGPFAGFTGLACLFEDSLIRKGWEMLNYISSAETDDELECGLLCTMWKGIADEMICKNC